MGGEEILARDEASMDLLWPRGESLEDSASLLDPHVLAQTLGFRPRKGARRSIRALTNGGAVSTEPGPQTAMHTNGYDCH